MTTFRLVSFATYASGFEADLALAQLEAAGIPAIRDNNDTSGLFGMGFQGATSHGITIKVPADLIEEAKSVVTLSSDPTDTR